MLLAVAQRAFSASTLDGRPRPLGNVLYVMPPYVITEEETRWVTDQIAEVLDEISGV